MTVEDIEAVASLARVGNQPTALDLGKYYVVQQSDGRTVEVNLGTDDYRDNPRRLKASPVLTDVDSLLSYWDKHHDDASDVFADRGMRRIEAIIDAHFGNEHEPDLRARWQAHRVTVTFTLSEAMNTLLGNDNALLDQVAFAELVDELTPFIVDPPAADLLEMGQSFQATRTASFKAGYKVVNGQRQLEYTEQIDAQIKGGAVAVPTTMALRVPMWRGSSAGSDLTARIRYRLNNGGPGKLGIGYKLDQLTAVIDAAFEAEVARVQEHIGRPVLRGTPAR